MLVGNSSKKMLDRAYEIYKKLEDDESRMIYKNRILYAFTREDRYWHEIVMYRNRITADAIEKLVSENVKFVIYGAGIYCQRVVDICRQKGCQIVCICDRDEEKQGNGYCDLAVISPEELIRKHKDKYVIISSINYRDEIREELLHYFPEEQVIPFIGDDMMEHMSAQYFDKGIMKYEDEEVFVDGGCFDFETSHLLMQRCNVKKVFAFEPDRLNLVKVKKGIAKSGTKEVEVFNKGLWNKTDELSFFSCGNIDSHIVSKDTDACEKIEVVALDEVIKEKVTFIKMDIEGSELKALEGAANLIRTYRPKLAICIYHKLEDVIDIPNYILSLVSEYRFYMRHYLVSPAETVLYAIC